MEYQQTPPPIPGAQDEYSIPKRAKTWLLESILVTIFCCLPFGIVGMVYAIKVNSLHDQTRYEESKRASKNAKRWTLIGLTIGIILGIIYLVTVAILGSMGSFSNINLGGPEAVYF